MLNDLEMDPILLSVRDLSIRLPNAQSTSGSALVLDLVSFDVERGSSVGVTGASGSGKSTLLRSILGLVDSSYITSGSIKFDGVDIMVEGRMTAAGASVRGSSLAFVWQNPKDMLHPMHRAVRQITEHLRIHEDLSKSEAIDRTIETLQKAGVTRPSELLGKYPHELSGGEAQRVCLAQALVTRPKLLVADEVLSSLDPATTTEVIETLNELMQQGLSLIFVSHDLDALAKLCRSTAVIYEGKMVEYGATRLMLDDPTHRHTKLLVQASRQLQGFR